MVLASRGRLLFSPIFLLTTRTRFWVAASESFVMMHVRLYPRRSELFLTRFFKIVAAVALVSVLSVGTTAPTQALEYKPGPSTGRSVGFGPMAVAVSRSGKWVAVANSFGNSVSILDASTLVPSPVSPFSVGIRPVALVFSADDSRLYVVNQGSNNVTVIDTSGWVEVAGSPVRVGNQPSAIAVDSYEETIFVTNYTDSTVSRFLPDDKTTGGPAGAHMSTSPTGSVHPTGISICADSWAGYLCITHANDDAVTVVSRYYDGILERVKIPGGALGIVSSSSTGKEYVFSAKKGISVLDYSTGSYAVSATVDLGISIGGLAMSPNGKILYATAYDSATKADRLFVLDVNTLSPITPSPITSTGKDPHGVAVNPLTGDVFVAHYISNTVSVFTATGTALSPLATGPVSVGGSPTAAAMSSSGDLLFVADGVDSVAVFDVKTLSLIEKIPVGRGPIAAVLDPLASRNLYVLNSDDGTLSVIDTKTLKEVRARVHVGDRAQGLAVSPDGSMILITNTFFDQLVALDSSTLKELPGSPVSVGLRPNSVVATWHKIFVSNYFGNTVSVLDISTFKNLWGSPVSVGQGPLGLDVTPDGEGVYVANSNSSSISIVNDYGGGFSQVAVVPVAGKPTQLRNAANPSGGTDFLYVTNGDGSTLSVLQENNFLAEPSWSPLAAVPGTLVPTGIKPSGIVTSSRGDFIYVMNSGSGTISAYSW